MPTLRAPRALLARVLPPLLLSIALAPSASQAESCGAPGSPCLMPGGFSVPQQGAGRNQHTNYCLGSQQDNLLGQPNGESGWGCNERDGAMYEVGEVNPSGRANINRIAPPLRLCFQARQATPPTTDSYLLRTPGSGGLVDLTGSPRLEDTDWWQTSYFVGGREVEVYALEWMVDKAWGFADGDIVTTQLVAVTGADQFTPIAGTELVLSGLGGVDPTTAASGALVRSALSPTLVPADAHSVVAAVTLVSASGVSEYRGRMCWLARDRGPSCTGAGCAPDL